MQMMLMMVMMMLVMMILLMMMILLAVITGSSKGLLALCKHLLVHLRSGKRDPEMKN